MTACPENEEDSGYRQYNFISMAEKDREVHIRD